MIFASCIHLLIPRTQTHTHTHTHVRVGSVPKPSPSIPKASAIFFFSTSKMKAKIALFQLISASTERAVHAGSCFFNPRVNQWQSANAVLLKHTHTHTRTHTQKSINYFTCTQHYYGSIGPQAKGEGVVGRGFTKWMSLAQQGYLPTNPPPHSNPGGWELHKNYEIFALCCIKIRFLKILCVVRLVLQTGGGIKKNSCISYPHSSTSLTKPYPKHPLWR